MVAHEKISENGGLEGGTHGYTINLIVIRTVKNEMCFSSREYIHRKSLFRSKALSFMPGFPLVM